MYYKMNLKTSPLLKEFMTTVILELKSCGRYSTAHVYDSVLRSVGDYCADPLTLEGLTPEFLKNYETHLIVRKNLAWNTSSTYLRCLQAVYNRAVERSLVPFIPRQFSGVFTGAKRNHRRALTASHMRRLLEQSGSVDSHPRLKKARICMELMLRLQGLGFVDLAHLRKSDLKNGYLVLQRHKTHMPLHIRVNDDTLRLIRLLLNPHPSSPYLLDILDGRLSGYASYRDYQKQLRYFNASLKQLAASRGVPVSVSTYCARHTWATQAKYCGIPTSVISEGLGHASVTTTEAYLKAFEGGVLDRANARVIQFIFSGKMKKRARCSAL